jgi:FixJ family two-component response regulator
MPNFINVFVVDDDASARNGLARLLRAAGHEVQPFSSPEDFLDALRNHHLRACELEGCVVLDASMSDLPGTSLAPELRRQGYHLPIIVLTADDNFATRQKALSMSVSGFFRKPIDGAALLDAIDWAHQSYYAEKTWKDSASQA